MAKTQLENLLASHGLKPEDVTEKQLKPFLDILNKMGIDPDEIQQADESFTCSICGEYFENEYSHNAQPVNDGRCCVLCNEKVVNAARLRLK